MINKFAVISFFFLSFFLFNKVISSADLKDKNTNICNDLRDKLNSFGKSPLARELSSLLLESSKKGCGSLVERLVNNGVIVDSRDRYANTPFGYASSAGHLEILKFLLQKGAKINHINLRGKNSLLFAIKNNRIKTVKFLLKNNADPNINTLDNEIPLSAAAFNGNQILVKYLLQNEANPDAIDGTGKSAIIYAAAKGFSSIVKVLIDKGVDVNKKYSNDLTALMWAAGHTNDTPPNDAVKTIEILIERGAKLNSVDNQNKTALDYAFELDNKKAIEVLQKNKAKRSSR